MKHSVVTIVLWLATAATCALLVLCARFTMSPPERTKSVRVDTRLRIAIVDTGFASNQTDDVIPLCDTGHYDVRTRQSGLVEVAPHGSVVATALARELQDFDDYCLIIIQGSDVDKKEGPKFSSEVLSTAIDKAVEAGAQIINLSISGTDANFDEEASIKNAVNHGIAIFTAAGNDRKDLNKQCNAYPACYKIEGLRVVGALDDEEERLPTSNIGSRIDFWENGIIYVRGERWQGTSIASPRVAARYARYLLEKRKRQIPMMQ